MVTRLALAMLAIGAVVLAVVAFGVLRVASDTFTALMVAAGDSATEAQTMFDQSVTAVFGVAALVAAISGGALALVLARRLARPIESLSSAATAVAGGDLTQRVEETGPQELRSLSEAFNEMADSLAEQERIRHEFVMNASHELRTPLTNLEGYLEALRDGVMEPTPALLESLGEEVDRLKRLAGSLEVLAGGEEERTQPREIDLGALVRSSVELAAPAFRRRSITIALDLADEFLVTARADDLSQVMANLLQNAARYTPANGNVTVTLTRSERGATVRVSNSGTEIPAADLPRVWERFYRVEKSRDRGSGGAGIGLAIVRRLIEDAGGNVGATSDQNVTSFWFSLPL